MPGPSGWGEVSPYEVVYEPALPRSRRTRLVAASGQDRLPALELPDGRWLFGDPVGIAARIRAGELYTSTP